MANPVKKKMTFLELAQQVLAGRTLPMTTEEIWSEAQKTGLVELLGSSGKTPERSLGAILYTEVNNANSVITKVSSRPARFMLKSEAESIPTREMNEQVALLEPAPTQERRFHERELHALVAHYAWRQFGAHCRTIIHERSTKRGDKHDQWVHPDMVAFSLPTKSWDADVVSLSRSSGAQLSKLYSFEIKISLEFGTLREYFFQAVSNSTWAHEGYLVAVSISDDPGFRDELRRLSQSFGIGVIKLDLDQPLDSEVELPARERAELDWATIDRIAGVNPDFKAFVSSVVKSMSINEPTTSGFDAILSEDQVTAYAHKLRKRM